MTGGQEIETIFDYLPKELCKCITTINQINLTYLTYSLEILLYLFCQRKELSIVNFFNLRDT